MSWSWLGNAITAVAALLGVFLGGWLTVRNQERQWKREHARQWRDIRLAAFSEFIAAYRQYVAFALEPTANITVVPHPRFPEMMPFFDDVGRPYKEKLESAITAVRLVCEKPDTKNAAAAVVAAVRQIAAARATSSADEVGQAQFDRLWAGQLAFRNAARAEVGLEGMDHDPPRG